MVDVGAPGVTIRSSIPGAVPYLEVSGTSQAAPYVARAAGVVVDMNSNLRPADIRRILMGTVDVKPFLAGKVMSGGIVNPERAALAASFSRNHSIDEAISLAKAQVLDLTGELSLSARAIREANDVIVPMPLAPLF
jgi:subtilisin family serine protease